MLPKAMPSQAARPVRLPAIEGLRGLAMTLVFFGHFEALFRSYLPAGGASLRVIQFLGVIAHQGVCFFLVLSGYFVYKSYLDNPAGCTTFVWRRVRRIYPPYVAMCGLYVVLSFLFPAESKIPSGGAAIQYLAGNLLMVSSRPLISVSWTIGTLLALYAIVPPFWAAVRYERWKPAYRIAFILAAVAIWNSLPKSIPMLEGRVAFVLVGFILYEAVIYAGAAFEAGGELPGLAILGCGYLLWYAADRGWTSFLHLPESWSHYSFLAPGLFYACGYVLCCRGRLASWLEHVGLPRLGRISYSYYLCHGLILKGLHHLLVTLRPESPSLVVFWVGLPIAYGCTLTAGWVWFRLVEVRLAAAFVFTPRVRVAAGRPVATPRPALLGETVGHA